MITVISMILGVGKSCFIATLIVVLCPYILEKRHYGLLHFINIIGVWLIFFGGIMTTSIPRSGQAGLRESRLTERIGNS